MSRKNVRIDMPIGNVDKTVKLGKSISARHGELGANSPLTDLVDMSAFDDLLADIVTNRTPAVADSRQKEAWNGQALTVIGIAPGQNLQVKGTVYWHVNQVQKFMVFKFKGNEEQASLWGFNVVVTETGGRRNVSFNVPYNSAEGLLELGTNIISKNATDGPATIFPPTLFNIPDFEAKVNGARTLRDNALSKNQASQAANELARNLCGYGEGQTSETPDTLYFFITQVRDLLLVAYDGNEEQLSTFGFNVVVSASSSAGSGGQEPSPNPTPNVVNLIAGQTVALMSAEFPETPLKLSVAGETVSFCTSPEELASCIGPGTRVMLAGESFEGTLTEFGLTPNTYLKATNNGPAEATVSYLVS